MRKATMEDIPYIMDIIKSVIAEMRTYDNTQWNESYPQQSDFENDIQREELYIKEQDGRSIGFICINRIEPEEYGSLNWTSDSPCLVLHRMAVDPDCRRRGIGAELMKFAEELAAERHLYHLKTDTYSINSKMNALFRKSGYRKTGDVHFAGRTRPFWCYEKILGPGV